MGNTGKQRRLKTINAIVSVKRDAENVYHH
jgi:hypothetical protein